MRFQQINWAPGDAEARLRARLGGETGMQVGGVRPRSYDGCGVGGGEPGADRGEVGRAEELKIGQF